MTCRNSRYHNDPERQGDCSCADEAGERASLLSGMCGWSTAEECQASARRCAYNGMPYLCKHHRCST